MEQAAVVGLSFQIREDLEPPRFASDGLRRLCSGITCPTLVAVSSCRKDCPVCFVVIRCCGDLEDVHAKTSVCFIASGGLDYTWKIEGLNPPP